MNEQTKEYGKEIIGKLIGWLNDEDFMEEQFNKNFPLFKENLHKLQLCIDGELTGAKFEVGEFVHNCKHGIGEKLDTQIVQISNRHFSENRGWVYGINYVGIDKEKHAITFGGSSVWWNEEQFQKIDNPLLLLIIQDYKLNNECEKKQRELGQIQSKQEKLQYAFQILSGVEL